MKKAINSMVITSMLMVGSMFTNINADDAFDYKTEVVSEECMAGQGKSCAIFAQQLIQIDPNGEEKEFLSKILKLGMQAGDADCYYYYESFVQGTIKSETDYIKRSDYHCFKKNSVAACREIGGYRFSKNNDLKVAYRNLKHACKLKDQESCIVATRLKSML